MKNKIRLALFVNANSEIGLGHLYRSIALAKEFYRHNIDVTFISPSPIVKDTIGNSFTSILSPLYQDTGYVENIKTIFSMNSFDIVFFDLLENELALHKFISHLNLFTTSLSSFEYTFDRFEDITFFPDAQTLPYSEITTDSGTTLIFSGPEYLIFRDEFENVCKDNSANQTPQIFISTGALDSFELLPMILEAIDSITLNIECYVVMNSLAKTKDTVHKLVDNSSKKITILESITNISEYMAKCDIAIINGGTTRYELALIGTPFIAISIHEAQFKITQRTIRDDAGINLGIKSEVSVDDIKNAVVNLLEDRNLLESMSKRLQNIFDINGKRRIIDITLKIYGQNRYEKNN